MGLLEPFCASSASKRHGEGFFLVYSLIWILVLMVVVVTRAYEYFSPQHYLIFGVTLALPTWLIPLVVAGNSVDRGVPFYATYTFKANVYVAILAATGNYFYTHYFYDVLGVRYTGPLAPGRGVDLNGVPLSMYFMSHPYFCLYHPLASVILRFVRRSCRRCLGHYRLLEFAVTACAVVALAWTAAFMETWTISSFPYYTYPDREKMLVQGSAFYALFFVVSFPMFSRLDEKRTEPWRMQRVVVEALATMMLVIWIADLWKLFVLPRME